MHASARALALGCGTAAVLLALVGCTAGPPGTTPSAPADPATDTAAAAPPTPSTDPCVPSPHEVTTARLPARAHEPVDDATAAELEAAVAEGLELTAAEGTVVGVLGPQGTWIHATGFADQSHDRPITVDEHFRVGSITKTFNGTMILQLAEEGALSLDDTIDQYVDGVPNGGAVTLRHLLDMTSGIESYTLDEEVADTYLKSPETVWTPQQLIAAASGLPPLFAPGADFSYSNTNAVLLGVVVEQVTGLPYPDALSERILEPLGLTQTSFPDTTAIPEPHPLGDTLQGVPSDSDTPADATDFSPTFAWSAGQIISTVDDMLVYGRALGTGQGMLGEDAAVARLTSFPGAEGYGLALGCLGGWVGHTGEIPGFNTTLFYEVETDTTVVVLTNSDIPTGDCSSSKTLVGNPAELRCESPANRIMVEVAAALGSEFVPTPLS